MRQQKGFTLIEVMIVVAIVAILSAIAIPSYTDYVRRSRLTEATAALSSMRVKMEQYYQDNRTYVGACLAAPPVTVANLPQFGPASNFAYACQGVNGAQYVVQATGQNSMAGFVYTINQANARATTGLPAGWAGNPSNCWVLKRDGTC